MSAEFVADILGIVITTVIAVYAILDVRKEAKRIVKLARDIAWLNLKNDMTWMFVDATGTGYPVEIAKQLHEFQLLYEALAPGVDPEDLRIAVENEALEFAEELVNKQVAVWKSGFDIEKVKSKIASWKADKGKEEVRKLIHSYF